MQTAPLFSVIVCSTDPARGRGIRAQYERVFSGQHFELIQIDDARSLCEGYNRGFARSHGELIVFSHDDIELWSGDFASTLRASLQTFDLVGVAGTSRLAGMAWWAVGRPYIHGRIIHRTEEGAQLDDYGPPPTDPVVALDGVFLAARRQVCEQVPFDEKTFDGFHFYDIDFTHRAHLAGFRLGICPVLLIHHSGGGTLDQSWRQYAERFAAKHRGRFRPILLPPPSPLWNTTPFDLSHHPESL